MPTIHIKLTTACCCVTAIAAVLAGVNLFVSNQLSTQGEVLAEINSEVTMLDKESIFLRQQIADASSLASLDQRAQNLGYVPINHPLALSKTPSVAFAR